jgi:hypothetical protein
MANENQTASLDNLLKLIHRKLGKDEDYLERYNRCIDMIVALRDRFPEVIVLERSVDDQFEHWQDICEDREKERQTKLDRERAIEQERQKILDHKKASDDREFDFVEQTLIAFNHGWAHTFKKFYTGRGRRDSVNGITLDDFYKLARKHGFTISDYKPSYADHRPVNQY